jgi:hypothetical protein
MTQVLPASVRRGGERERRFLRAQTLPQVASLWSGACEQRPATALALLETTAPRDAACEPRPAMAHSLSLLARLAGASPDGPRARGPEMPRALLAAARQGGAWRDGACAQQAATALALPEAAARRYAAWRPQCAMIRSVPAPARASPATVRQGGAWRGGVPGWRPATAQALPAAAQQGGANGQRPAMAWALPAAAQQDAVWQGGTNRRRATARTLLGMRQGGKRRRQAMAPASPVATVRSRLSWTNQAHAAPTWRTARIVGCALPFGRLPHRRRNRGRRVPDRRSPTRCPARS